MLNLPLLLPLLFLGHIMGSTSCCALTARQLPGALVGVIYNRKLKTVFDKICAAASVKNQNL